MSITNKLAIRNIKLNKKISSAIIIGITLSVALIVMVSGLTESFLQTMIQTQIKRNGNYHIQLSNLTDDELQLIEGNRDFEPVALVSTVGYSEFDYGFSDIMNYLRIQSFVNGSPQELGYTLVEGEYATNNNELVLTVGAASDSGYEVGDTIEIKSGQLPERWDDTGLIFEERTSSFIITGIVSHFVHSSSYHGFTREHDASNYTSYLRLKNVNNYKQDMAELLGIENYEHLYELGDSRFDFYSINYELISWEAFDFSEGTLQLILLVALILVSIIIINSVLAISNSFSISTTEKMKTLAMLTSVGATKTQIKRQVLTEAFILGAVGIPFGILFGVLFQILFAKFVNTNLSKVTGGFNIFFTVSWQGIVISVVLGLLTIYLSARSSIRRVGKISPIEHMRGTDEIKIPPKKLNTSTVIYRLFGMGGVIADKNMKRSSRKYRTTVISLTVSIFAFISLSTFSSRALVETKRSVGNRDYSLNLGRVRSLSQNDLFEIENIEGVNSIKTTYVLDGDSYIDLKGQNVLNSGIDPAYQNMLGVVALEENYFKKVAQEMKIEPSCEGVILYDKIESHDENNEVAISRAFKYESHDVIQGLINNEAIEMEVLVPEDYQYVGSYHHIYTNFVLINKSVFEEILDFVPHFIEINADDNAVVIEKVLELSPQISITDYQAEAQQGTVLIQLVSYFVYGFILVITMIGITNIFNTITSNIALRQSEFAMLRSIGMTQSEFNQMINLETIFYSTKSLTFGVILGVLGSLAIQSAFNSNSFIESSLTLPIRAILLSIVFVFLIVFIIMRYSIGKIKQQNIIETIRKVNH